MATIFDFINGLTHNKKEWSEWTEPDRKGFSPYMINRWLSMRMELTEVINELQKYTVGQLKHRDVYKLYHGFLPNNKSWAKYIKGKKEDKYDPDLVKIIQDHYQLSKFEALDYIPLATKADWDELVTMYGYSIKEKKRMLKGLK